jgi:hypothetical protein
VAGVSLHETESGAYHVYFRFAGKQHHYSLKTDDRVAAKTWQTQIAETRRDLECGKLVVPAGHVREALNVLVDDLRSRLAELPRDREIAVYCQVGQRATWRRAFCNRPGLMRST